MSKGFDKLLDQFYSTTKKEELDAAEKFMEKLAADTTTSEDEQLEKLLDETPLEDLVALAQELTKTAETPQEVVPETEDEEMSEEEFTKLAETVVNSDWDLGGRIMAHALINELRSINEALEKEAAVEEPELSADEEKALKIELLNLIAEHAQDEVEKEAGAKTEAAKAAIGRAAKYVGGKAVAGVKAVGRGGKYVGRKVARTPRSRREYLLKMLAAGGVGAHVGAAAGIAAARNRK
jgi:ElaB/YqjD/DUF883 family membrane-anchored ribosome-binding protein